MTKKQNFPFHTTSNLTEEIKISCIFMHIVDVISGKIIS